MADPSAPSGFVPEPRLESLLSKADLLMRRIRESMKLSSVAPYANGRQDSVSRSLLISLDTTLYDYQMSGVKWLLSLFESNLNGILADQMGLGE